MNEKAEIIEIKNDLYMVKCKPQPECESCKGNSFCKVSDKILTALNPKNLDIHQGDNVAVFFPEGKAIKASFIVLILPLIIFIVAYLIVAKIFPKSSEIIPLIAGLLGMVGSFGITALFSRKNTKNLPVITNKLEDNDEK